MSPDHLLDLISELFYAADVDERHSLDKRKLQARSAARELRTQP